MSLGLDWFGSGEGEATGYCVCGNEPQGFKQCGKFLNKPREDLISFQRESSPCS